MDDISKILFSKLGVNLESLNEHADLLIERDIFLCQTKYENIKYLIPELKKIFSSSTLTALHINANTSQKWPLLNLVRQILGVYKFKLQPIRKSDGYTPDGKKKYKRFFNITKTCL
jgi:hypothetical protein